MNRAMNNFDRARHRLAGDFKAMITDSEELLQAAASVSGEGFKAARSKFEGKLQNAKAALADASQPLVERSRETAAVADDYVSTNPWTAVGVAVAAGALLGIWVAKR